MIIQYINRKQLKSSCPIYNPFINHNSNQVMKTIKISCIPPIPSSNKQTLITISNARFKYQNINLLKRSIHHFLNNKTSKPQGLFYSSTRMTVRISNPWTISTKKNKKTLNSIDTMNIIIINNNNNNNNNKKDYITTNLRSSKRYIIMNTKIYLKCLSILNLSQGKLLKIGISLYLLHLLWIISMKMLKNIRIFMRFRLPKAYNMGRKERR